MPRSGDTYTAPSNSWNPAVGGATIGSADWNALLTDIVAALTDSTSFAAGQKATYLWAGVVGGTADALTATLSPAITAYNNGMMVRFVTGASANTTTATLAVNGLAATTIKLNGAALGAGTLAADTVYTVVYYSSAWHLFGQAAGSSGGIPVRQTVLSSAVDSNGFPNYITAGSGLSAAIAATTTPIVLTVANGFGSAGQIDRVGRVTADTTISSLTGAQSVSSITRSSQTATVTTGSAHGLVTGSEITMSGATQTEYNITAIVTVTGSTTFTYTVAGSPATPATGSPVYTVTNFLYGDVASGGTVTLGKGLLPPVYQFAGTYSTTADQFTFNIQEMVGKVGNGSAAAQTYRVYIGEAKCSSSAVTSQVNYALLGRYTSAFTSTLPSTSTSVAFSSNIGTNEIYGDISIEIECLAVDNGYAIGDRVRRAGANSGGGASQHPIDITTRNTVQFSTGSTNAFYSPPKGGGANTGLTAASWKYRLLKNRGW